MFACNASKAAVAAVPISARTATAVALAQDEAGQSASRAIEAEFNAPGKACEACRNVYKA